MNEQQPPDWPAILRAFRDRDCAVAEFCRRNGISASSLYRRLAAEARQAQARKPARGGRRRKRCVAAVPVKGRGGLFARLSRALDEKMTEFETAIRAQEPRSPADAEREARTLLSLMRMFERLNALQPNMGKGSADPANPRLDADADAIRRQLAERLERLRSRNA